MGQRAKYWIKLYLDILRDGKMGKMSDRLFRRTVELFLIAGETGNGGSLPTIEDMSWTLRTTPEQLETELLELKPAGIVHYDAGAGRWFVTNFEKRQKPSPDAERMRRMRERKKEEEIQLRNKNKTDSYGYVTRYVTVREHRNENVTIRNDNVTIRNDNQPRDDEHAVELVLELLEFWLDLTGGSAPSNREPRVNDYFMPINRLLIRVGWNVDAGAALLERKRVEMLNDGKTPYRPAAVVPYIMGELDAADQPGVGSNNRTDERLDRIMAGMENEVTNAE